MSNTPEGNLCASIESLEIDQTEKLDHLLECYLDLLDQYTTLRRQLSQHLSAVRFLPPSPVTSVSDVSPQIGLPFPRTSKFPVSESRSLRPGLLR